MTDEFVSFQTAKLAKEKRFNPDWSEFYNTTIYRINSSKDVHLTLELVGNVGIREFLAPTQSLLQRWLREVHNINIVIESFQDRDNQLRYRFTIYTYIVTETLNLNRSMLLTYEEALEEALFTALNLI